MLKSIIGGSDKIYQDTHKALDYQGSTPKSCFCTGRSCPMYEHCFEKEKIIARQDKTIGDLLAKIFELQKREGVKG